MDDRNEALELCSLTSGRLSRYGRDKLSTYLGTHGKHSTVWFRTGRCAVGVFSPFTHGTVL